MSITELRESWCVYIEAALELIFMDSLNYGSGEGEVRQYTGGEMCLAKIMLSLVTPCSVILPVVSSSVNYFNSEDQDCDQHNGKYLCLH